MKTIITTVLAALVFTACQAGRTISTEYLYPAVKKDAPETIVVEKPVPVPMPGQLKPLPDKPGEKKTDPQIIKEGMETAKQGVPDLPHGWINSITVYDYMPGSLYQVYCAAGYVTDIIFQEGEQIISDSAGDTVRWQTFLTEHGAGRYRQQAYQVKPVYPDITTNLVIKTSLRTYYFELHSLPDNTYMAAVSFRYPQQEIGRIRERVQAQTEEEQRTIGHGINPAKLDFDYKITGDSPKWKPARVFNDGDKTYIQFTDELRHAETPVLFLLSDTDQLEIVNYRQKGNYYVIDQIIDRAVLTVGEKKQITVKITRNKG